MASASIEAPAGTWQSPITSAAVTARVVGLSSPMPGPDGRLAWLESRPDDGGRTVLVVAGEDVLPAPFSVRSRAHEYGGGSCCWIGDQLLFCNDSDQGLYTLATGGTPQALLLAAGRRFADLLHDPARNRILAVCEDHNANPGGEARTSLVAISLTDGSCQELHSGHDFYASPRLHPDGSRCAFLTWDHPRMPWDGTELHQARVAADGSLGDLEQVAGGPETSVFQPEYSPAGDLYCVADPDGWWNLHRVTDSGLESLCPDQAEYGLPQWVFGMRTWGFAGDGSLVAIRSRGGRHELGRIAGGRFHRWDNEWVELADLVVADDHCWFIGSSPRRLATLVERSLTGFTDRSLRRAADNTFAEDLLAEPEAVHFPTSDGHTGHAWFYPPTNPDYRLPAGEVPPLLVMTHGGPTACARLGFNARVQYYTSRGWAVADVNYGGSTGFGRSYRDRLKGQWGVVDVADCQAVVQHLANARRIDAGRVAIRGGSAGGYTTLAALAFSDSFAAGASHYGIGDLELLARDTHKFESRYLDSLVGPWPEAEALYRERSPIHAVDRLRCPVAFFQGLDDKVVPPNQAETMVAALQEKGIEVAYEAYPGEGHGFRKAANIRAALDGEYQFFCRVFGISLPATPVRRAVLLAGGPSAEAEVSQTSARAVQAALADGPEPPEVVLLAPDADLPAALARLRPDVVFPVLHGPPGEDGTVQGLLEILGVPYVGSGVHASACAMDKVVAKQLFRLAGLPLAKDLVVQPGDHLPDAAARISAELGPDVAVKPARQGSALGITPVHGGDGLLPALEQAAAFGDAVLVEEFVHGRELTVGVLDLHGEQATATPVIEITTPGDSWYDYQHRYTAGLSDHLVPAQIPAETAAEAQRIAIAAHRVLGCRDLSRADFLLDTNGQLVLLEVNTLPGFTPLSLYPDGVRAMGMSFPELVRALLASAAARAADRR